MEKETLQESPFVRITFEKDKKLIRFTYLEGTSQMEDEDFKEMMMSLLSKLRLIYAENDMKLKSLLFLSDLRDMFFVVVPELQSWTDSEFTFYALDFIKKSAVILPESLVANVATQQALGEDNASKISTRHFDSEEEALEWLYL